MSNDRFTKISDNYASLAHEVFKAQGLDYRKLQDSVFDAVKEDIPDFRNKAILDIGIGDGETSLKFIEAGCKNITGIDLNPTMLEQAKNRFDDKVKLIKADTRDLGQFHSGEFDIIISGTTIHNIPKTERQKVWSELLRLNPEIIALLDKIADPDPDIHKQNYDREVAALKEVYEKHKMHEAAKEWEKHYEVDEKEKMELQEVKENLSKKYDIKLVFEMGMNKTVVCKRK